MDVFKEREIIAFENVAEATNLLQKSLLSQKFAIRLWDFRNKSEINEDYGEHLSKTLSQNLTHRQKAEIQRRKIESFTPNRKNKDNEKFCNSKHFHILDPKKKPFRKPKLISLEDKLKQPNLKDFRLFDSKSNSNKCTAESSSPIKSMSNASVHIGNFKESLKDNREPERAAGDVIEYINRLKQKKSLSNGNLLKAVKKIPAESCSILPGEFKSLTSRSSHKEVFNDRRSKGGSLASSNRASLKDTCKDILKNRTTHFLSSQPDPQAQEENHSRFLKQLFSASQINLTQKRDNLQDFPNYKNRSNIFLLDANLHHLSQSPIKESTFLTSVRESTHRASQASIWVSNSNPPTKRMSASPRKTSEMNLLKDVMEKCWKLEENTKHEKEEIKEIGKKIENDIESLQEKLTESELKFEKSDIKGMVEDFNHEKKAFIYGRRYQGMYIMSK
ncbi:unnamed protein product [Blepharisma stoltei]|uniref:Uncharacterized protein n=1 Tax=Blepharisma stoltei TaxID=1481888 RepID=A0AAU9KBT1_9CILI|nr:unnamed protein product [Blepharisma stoltei]